MTEGMNSGRMIGLRLHTRRPPACLALSAKRRLHRSIDGDARARGEQGVGRREAEGMARSGEEFGRGRAGGTWGGKGEEVGGESGEEGGVGCGSSGGGSVCGGEACDTELRGFLSLQMSGR